MRQSPPIAAHLAEEQPPQFQDAEDTLFVDLTLGVAMHPTHANSAESLYRRAELALNEASAKDLNSEIYRPDATQEQVTLWKFQSDLERAIKSGGIEVFLQPKVRISDGEMTGAEALIRGRQESGRLILPGEFIPLSERSGSIVPLTWLEAKSKSTNPLLRTLQSMNSNGPALIAVHPRFGRRRRRDGDQSKPQKPNSAFLVEQDCLGRECPKAIE